MRVTTATAAWSRVGIVLWGSLMVAASAWAQGEVSFVARRDFPVGEAPRWVATGDFNGDGHADVATANVGPPRCRSCSAAATAPSRRRRRSA